LISGAVRQSEPACNFITLPTGRQKRPVPPLGPAAGNGFRGHQLAAHSPTRPRHFAKDNLHILKRAFCDAGGFAGEHVGEFDLLFSSSGTRR